MTNKAHASLLGEVVGAVHVSDHRDAQIKRVSSSEPVIFFWRHFVFDSKTLARQTSKNKSEGKKHLKKKKNDERIGQLSYPEGLLLACLHAQLLL